MGRRSETTADAGRAEPRECVFSPRVRRNALIYVAATAPIVVLASLIAEPLLGGLGAKSTYIITWVLVSGLYTTPALVAAWMAAHRAPETDRRFWRTWSLGMVLVYLVGCSLLAEAALGIAWARPVAAAAVAASCIVFGIDLVRMMRSRSGKRDVLIDMLENSIVVAALIPPFVVVFGETIVRSPDAWYAVPAALAAGALVCSLGWSIMLFARLEAGGRLVEGLGVAVAMLGLVDAVFQVAQGVTGFAIPLAPLLLLQAVCLGIAFLTPMNLPRNLSTGLDRFPPQAQVRSGRLIAVPCVLVIPVMAVEIIVYGGERPWVSGYAFGVLAAIVVLATLRHLLTTAETRRLFSEVEQAAEDRRALLAEVLERSDADRHRVAAQLHEQAVGAYASVKALAREAGGAKGVEAVRDDLARQADSLRQLMMAIRPIEVASTRPESLRSPIEGYLDGLYGWRPTPTLILEIDDDLHLDWTTETVALRILQEALRNVRKHAHATVISITLRATDEGVVLVVEDDGIGFDPGAALFESGIATMRTFALHTGGTCEVTSRPGAGTSVEVLLGSGAVTVPEPRPADEPEARTPAAPSKRRAETGHLRLVPGGLNSLS